MVSWISSDYGKDAHGICRCIWDAQLSSVTQSCLNLCDPMDCSTPGLPVHHQLPEFTQTHVHWVGDAIQPSHPLLSPSPPPSIFSSIRVFSNESPLHIRWPKYWSFSFNISPSNEHSGLISFRTDWLDRLEVQGTLTSLLQHHSSKASILQHYLFFLLFLLPWKTDPKDIATIYVKEYSAYILGVLRFQVLHLSLESILNLFLYTV